MTDAESVLSAHLRNHANAPEIVRQLCFPSPGLPRVCPYCALRFSNLQNPKPYFLSPSVLRATLERWLSLDAGIIESPNDARPCAVCFNISENALWERPSLSTAECVSTESSNVVKDAVRSSLLPICRQKITSEFSVYDIVASLCAPYDVSSETYTLCITIPHLVTVREFAVCNFLAKGGILPALSDHALPNVVELKQMLRWRMGEWVEANLKETRPHQDGLFQIEITYNLDTGVEEIIQVLLQDDKNQVCQKSGRSKKRKWSKPYSNSTETKGAEEKVEPKLGDKINGSMIERAMHRFIKGGGITPKFVWPPPVTAHSFLATYEASVKRAAIFLLGRYNKFMRGVSQSPWLIENNRIGATSVEEVVGNPIQKLFCATEYKFHSAGREDIDVRMLGKGRPFILELLDAKRRNIPDKDIDDAEAVLNASQDMVKISCLHLSNKAMMATLHAYSENKRKTYACVVWTSRRLTAEDIEKVNGVKDLEIQQMTPVRVLHRRTLLTRSRMIHAIKCVQLNPHYFIVYLDTSAGTYVKEFIHGDFGRTSPNFGSLTNCTADILQLDVTELEGVDNMCDSKKWK
jgi:tRNA pseudouridine(54/55) synthase